MIIVLQQQPHDRFTRQGDDLHMNLTIGVTEALCGFKIPIQHLDGRELLVTNSPGKVVEPGIEAILSFFVSFASIFRLMFYQKNLQ